MVKPLYAWLLILLIAIQWVGGYVSVKVIHSIELERQMDRLEQRVAEALQAEAGIQAHVKILEEEELAPRGVGYGNFFPIMHEVDSATVYYVIQTDSTTVIDHEYILGNASKQANDKFALIEQLFSTFMLEKGGIEIAPQAANYPNKNFSVTNLNDIFQPDTRTPPPKLI